MRDLTSLQKIFTTIGFIGVFLLIPGLIHAAGNPFLVEWLENNLGVLGNRAVITVVAYCMMSLMFIFGGGHNVSATFVGYLIGFLLMSTAVQINFMHWFVELSKYVGFLSSPPLNYMVGTATVVAGVLMSFNKNIPFWGELTGLIVVPFSFLILSYSFGWFHLNNEFKISMDEGLKSLNEMIEPKYRNMSKVKKYVEDVHNDEKLSKDDKEKKIKELQDKIKRMEGDQKVLENLKKDNEKYQSLLNNQKLNLKDFGWCADAKSTSMANKNYYVGVRPDQPCVRDFAVSLVKNEPGAYDNKMKGIPSESGIKQICALHTHLSTNWKYVSDPTTINLDYNSPADRTIAVGLAGDCDDFAVLNASCIEAIGGKSRILIGQCDEGWHAWCEVLIGNEADLEKVKNTITRYFKKLDKRISFNKDSQNRYWLSLDWILGEYSCGDRNLQIRYDCEKKK